MNRNKLKKSSPVNLKTPILPLLLSSLFPILLIDQLKIRFMHFIHHGVGLALNLVPLQLGMQVFLILLIDLVGDFGVIRVEIDLLGWFLFLLLG